MNAYGTIAVAIAVLVLVHAATAGDARVTAKELLLADASGCRAAAADYMKTVRQRFEDRLGDRTQTALIEDELADAGKLLRDEPTVGHLKAVVVLLALCADLNEPLSKRWRELDRRDDEVKKHIATNNVVDWEGLLRDVVGWLNKENSN